MAIQKKTVVNLLLFTVIISFFVTPLGHFSKVFLNEIFAGSPKIISTEAQKKLPSYNWKLKDEQWNFFNFNKSEGKVVFINFWASWRLPCEAELKDVQALYDDFGQEIDFYIITNEERAPVEEFMKLKKFSFPVTYQIIGEPSPLEIIPPPASYLIDKKGNIVIKEDDIADWDSNEIRSLLTILLKS